MIEHPFGAIIGEELMALRRKYDGNAKSTTKVHVVMVANGHLRIGGSKGDDGHIQSFCFGWDPSTAYYFHNYFYAFAYSVRRKAELGIGAKEMTY